MEKNLLTAIIYDEDDANLFLKKKTFADRILPITPNAQAILLECSVPLISTLDIYTDYRQARVIARVRRMEADFFTAIESEKNLEKSTKETLRNIVYILCLISASFWELVKDLGHCLLPDKKRWIKLDDPKKIHRFLLEHLQPQIQKTLNLNIDEPVIPFFIKMINGLGCLFRKQQSLVFFTDFSYGLNELPYHKNFDKFVLSLRSANKSWKDILLSTKFLLDSIARKKKATILIVPKYSIRSSSSVKRVLKTIKDPVLMIGINIVFDFLVKTVVLIDGSKVDIRKKLRTLKPLQIIAGQLRWGIPSVMGQTGKELNIPVTLISHGSHPVPDSSTAAIAQKNHAQGQLVSPLTDVTLLQSPHAKAYSQKLGCKNGLNSRPIMWGNSKCSLSPKKSEIRYILHAGTYKQWVSPRTWIYETPDEYIKGLKSLIHATCKFKKTKLIIRIRDQSDCSISNLKKLLPKSENYEIKSSGNFLDDLSNADLLVSWSSTAIEEALHLRKPVLLWGGSNRYFHLPSDHKFPTMYNRCGVYAPKTINDLSPMIEAILKSHFGKPLTDEELSDHVWPNNIPGVDEFICHNC